MSNEATHSVGDDALLERVVGRIETTNWLGRWSEVVHPVVKKLIGRGKRQDLLTGRWLGHPAHPAGVVLPMSCWFAASLLDVAGGRSAQRSAQRLVGAGVVAALPVSATGAADWLYTGDAEQRVGTAHAILNNAAMALFAGSWWARRRGRRPLGVALGLTGTAVTGSASFLGGHLTYRRGVGVNTTSFQSGPEEWTELMLAAEPKVDAPVLGEIGDLSFAVVRDDGPDGAVRVMESRCTHRGAPLHEGGAVDGCIVCPWHDSRFDLATGAVLAGPASIPQPVYETRRDGDRLMIRRSEAGALRTNSVDARPVT